MTPTGFHLRPAQHGQGRAATCLAALGQACGWLALACCVGLGGCRIGPSKVAPPMVPPSSQMPGQPPPELIPGQYQPIPGQLPAPPPATELPPPTAETRAPAPTSRLVEHGLAVRATRQGHYAEADVHFLRAWQLGPPTAELLNDMGYRLYLEGRLPEAEAVFRQALFLEPRHVAAVLNLGRTLARQGRVAESLSVFRQINGEAEAEANVAYVLADWGNMDAAQAHYGRASEISVAQRQDRQNATPIIARLPASGPGDYYPATPPQAAAPQGPVAPPATARITQVRPVD